MYIFALILLWSELWPSLRFFLRPRISCLVEYLMYIWKGYVSTVLDVSTSWLIILFKSSVSLLIYFKLLLSINEREVLKFPTKIADLCIYLICIRLCFLLFEVLLLYEFILRITISFGWINLYLLMESLWLFFFCQANFLWY